MARRRRRGRKVLLGLAPLALLAACSGTGATNAATQVTTSPDHCNATLVHYRPYKGMQAGLERLPWIAALPTTTSLVGHLFYYDDLNIWKEKQLPGFRIYSGAQSPDGRVSMKILWELRRGRAIELRVRGKRLDRSGSFSELLASTSSNSTQFPSIINIPTAGCWRLTLKAGRTTGQITVLAVPMKNA